MIKGIKRVTHLVHSDLVPIRLFKTKWRVEEIVQSPLSTLKHIEMGENKTMTLKYSKDSACFLEPSPLHLLVLSEL